MLYLSSNGFSPWIQNRACFLAGAGGIPINHKTGVPSIATEKASARCGSARRIASAGHSWFADSAALPKLLLAVLLAMGLGLARPVLAQGPYRQLKSFGIPEASEAGAQGNLNDGGDIRDSDASALVGKRFQTLTATNPFDELNAYEI